MATPFHALIGALVALVFWTAVGLPLARRTLGASLAWPFAPALGWAAHNVVALPVFFLVPFTTTAVALVAMATLALAWFATRSTAPEPRGPAITTGAWVAAALLALVVAAAILPKQVGDAIALSDPVFDHAKVAMIDDMARLGLPPGNPFIAHDGGSGRLSYYYLWHFSAAALVRATGVSGWEADVAMTFFSAFASLAAMMALAVRFSGRAQASLWVVVLAASASSRVLWLWLVGGATLDRWLPPPGGFGGWLFQSAWVPQHLMAATCVLLAVLSLDRLAAHRDAWSVVSTGLVMAAAFESSTWIGGVVFALVAVVIVPLTIVRAAPARRPATLAALAIAGAVTLAFAWPLLADQFAAAALRQRGAPVAVHPFAVLGQAFAPEVRAWLDAPAFWIVLLPIEFTAVYLTGLYAMVKLLAARNVQVVAFAATALVALLAAWLLASTLADNNDLAWRAVLLAATLLIVFAAAQLASWIAARRWLPAGLALCACALGWPEAALQIGRNLVGHPAPDGRAFAAMPDLWKKVREHSTPTERIANHPDALRSMSPWSANLGWALLADRRSCYATWELTQVYSSVPHDRLRAIDGQFVRVFDGAGTADDVRQLAEVYDCDVAVVTPQDGAWQNDPFRGSRYYALADEDPARWRIYRRIYNRTYNRTQR